MSVAEMNPSYITYKPDIEQEIRSLATAIQNIPDLQRYNPRWLAVQLLEEDEILLDRVRHADGGHAVLEALDRSRSHLLGGKEEEQPSDLMTAIRAGFEQSSGGHGALAALAFMVFVLLYTPCMVAVAAEWQEFGAPWTLASIVGQFVLAWLATLGIYQGGLLLGLG